MGAWYYLLTKIHSQPDSACTSAKHTLGTTHRTRRPGLKCAPQIFNASLAIPDQTHNFFLSRVSGNGTRMCPWNLLVVSSHWHPRQGN